MQPILLLESKRFAFQELRHIGSNGFVYGGRRHNLSHPKKVVRLAVLDCVRHPGVPIRLGRRSLDGAAIDAGVGVARAGKTRHGRVGDCRFHEAVHVVVHDVGAMLRVDLIDD